MKRIFILMFLVLPCGLPAAAPGRRPEQLRDLAVFPVIPLEPGYHFVFRGGLWMATAHKDAQPEIRELREQLKSEPENIPHLLRLGNLLAESAGTNAARDCFATAERLSRKKIAARSGDGNALTQLGESLFGLGRIEEAETIFRKATIVSSNQWGGWYDLGRFLTQRSFAALLPPELRYRMDFFADSISRDILDYRPTPDSLLRAEECGREALLCFDRAVALAPDRPGLRFQRAGNRCFSDWKDRLIRHMRDQDSLDAAALRAAFFSPAALSDFQKAAELDTADYRTVAMAAWFEVAGVVARNPGVRFETLPEETRQSVRQTMTRLENLAVAPDKTSAAGACEMLAILNLLSKNVPAAKENCRRSVALDQTRESSWDMLLSLSLDGSTPQEMVELCEARLKGKKSARNYLLLAKALTRQEKWKDAAEQTLAAARRDTNNVAIPLMLAAIAIRGGSGAETNSLAAAAKALQLADDLLGQMPPDDETRMRWREHRLNVAIFLALHGEADDARNWANNVLKYYPKDETAGKILKALE